jgi:Rhs element Vgr protein
MSVYTVRIRSDGAEIGQAYGLVAADVVKQVDRIPDATLTLLEQASPDGDFSLSDADAFSPGKEIEIAAAWLDAAQSVLFVGRVVRHGVRLNDNGLFLNLELRDAALKLTRPRRCRAFVDLTDGDVFSRLVQDAGLGTGEVASTQPSHPTLVQYRASDWDFLLARAHALGLSILVDDGELSLRAPDLSAAAELVIAPGIDELFELELTADALDQEAAVSAVGWDPAAQQLSDPAEGAEFDLPQAALQPATVAGELGFDAAELLHPVPLLPEELAAAADGRLRRNRLSMLRGRVSLRGSPAVKPFQLVELQRVGTRFPGKALITGVRHRLDQSGWRTDLTLGLDPRRLAAAADLAEAPAAGLLPPVSGLQVGIVADLSEDPGEEFRIGVRLPALGADAEPIRARLLTPHAGAEHGFVFKPELEDEVIVGFLNDDPRVPVILGALFSSARPPPGDYAEADDENLAKGIVTRSGTTIGIVDGDTPRLVLKTPGGNQVLIDDENEQIELTDQHGNALVMNADGIAITSAADLTLEAGGDVTITGQAIDMS